MDEINKVFNESPIFYEITHTLYFHHFFYLFDTIQIGRDPAAIALYKGDKKS